MLKSSLLAAAALLVTVGAANAQTTKNLVHPAPDGMNIGFLLTDGTVLAQGYNGNDFWKLTPDNTGSYVNGTWTQVASLPSGYDPDAGSSAVIADGRLIFVGGEYNFGNFDLTDICTVYDPVANTWTEFDAPKGWHYIGDSPNSVLPNGGFLLGRKLSEKIAVLSPSTLTWTEMHFKGKADFNAEEGWTLLPNGTILTADVKDGPNTEIYDPKKQRWTTAGKTPVALNGPPEEGPIHFGKNNKHVYDPPGEIGPAILRPDGTVYATGATPKGGSFGYTAIYTPGANGATGTWAAGPNFPNGEDAGDSFATLLVTGNVLVEAESGRLYEFNGTTLTQTQFNGDGALLVLPSGEILLGGDAVYRPSGTVNSAWAPTITSVPSELTPGNTYTISGTQFNGLSQANSFGDEFQTNTNYPLVRITNTASGQVYYARTHDHSTMGVATGNATVSTNFDVPANAPTGASTLVVVANGIPSAPANVTIE
jgi:hypothetical protein